MNIIVVVDDKCGMMFNNRRQSQDRVLREKICGVVKDKCLWMNNYSIKQFSDMEVSAHIRVAEDFLEKTLEGEYCFVENVSLKSYEQMINEIILFKWNRVYPADVYFDIDLHEQKWRMTSMIDFRGHSHDKITMEVYDRVQI